MIKNKETYINLISIIKLNFLNKEKEDCKIKVRLTFLLFWIERKMIKNSINDGKKILTFDTFINMAPKYIIQNRYIYFE